jgi:serine/threonine-protein kinase HipA
MNPVEMLCFMGTRGMGALEFEPTVLKESKRTFSIVIDSLVVTAQKILNQREAFTPISKRMKNKPFWKF